MEDNGNGLAPKTGAGVRQMEGRAERLSVCRCGRKIEYRWTDPAHVPEILEGMRGTFKAAIRCEGCGTVNVRNSNDVLRYARTIGAFDSPDIVLGLIVTRRVLLARLLESQREPNPDRPPPKTLEDRDLAKLSSAIARVSDLEAIMAGAKVERREILTVPGGRADPALDDMVEKVAEEIARKLGIVRDAEVVSVDGTPPPV